MTIKTFFLTVLLVIATFTIAQTKQLIIPQNINLPKDTIVSNKLIKSLNGFLSQKENENKTNTFVLNEDLVETSVLLDEMKEIEKSTKYKDDNFYKGYLTNVVQLDGANFLIQFSYIGVTENTPILAASFEILAKQKGDTFYFLSPLKRNTSSWKTKMIGENTFHYKNYLNDDNVKKYEEKVAFFNKKFNISKGKLEWYGCNDITEVLKNIGVVYKLVYNGQKASTFTAKENNTFLMVDGTDNGHFDTFDPHDLFHDKASSVIETDKINRSMVCGTAYIYGGSWGISYPEILKKFKSKMLSDPKVDWLKLYREGYNFGDSEEKHLLVTQLINSLIIQKIEKEKGFSVAIELMSSGNFRRNEENFFKIVEKNTGINKTNFNDSVWKLINESGK
jgi:hypothetical protein